MKGENLSMGLSAQKPANIEQSAPSVGEKTQRPAKMEKSVSAPKGKKGSKFCI